MGKQTETMTGKSAITLVELVMKIIGDWLKDDE